MSVERSVSSPTHTCHSRPSLPHQSQSCTSKERYLNLKLELPILNVRDICVFQNLKGGESIHTWEPWWPTRHNMNLPSPVCRVLFRELRHKGNLMCMDFLLMVIRLSGGLYSLCEDLEPQTAVIETDSGLSTMTLWITTIITPIIITAALHAHKVLR